MLTVHKCRHSLYIDVIVNVTKINRIYHHVAGGTRESHPRVQDLQSTTRLAESWMLQILGHEDGIPESLPQCGDYSFFSYLQNAHNQHRKSNKQRWFPSFSRHIGVDVLWRQNMCMWRHSAVDGKNQCLQGQVYLHVAWVRPCDLTTGKIREIWVSSRRNKFSHYVLCATWYSTLCYILEGREESPKPNPC